jgi:hypothetical protein
MYMYSRGCHFCVFETYLKNWLEGGEQTTAHQPEVNHDKNQYILLQCSVIINSTTLYQFLHSHMWRTESVVSEINE